MNQETKTCQNCKKEFVIEPEDFDFYEKIKVPAPTWCPECRMIRRMLWRNERKLFRRKDGLTGKDLLSLYPAESGWPVYHESDWWNLDLWDPLSYGQDFDPQKPFLLQLFELCQKVPKPHSDAVNMVNSEYSANAADMKNCYLVFNSAYDEDCGYGVGFTSSKNCYDCSYADNSESCYGSFWIAKCNKANFCSQCVQCLETWFCKDCLGCSNCFGCMNLRNKKYCIFNVQYTKEEYQQKIAAMKLNSWKGIEEARATAYEFWEKNPNKYHQGIKNINSTGAYVTNSKNVRQSYIVREAEDCKYVQYMQTPGTKDCYDLSIWGSTNQLGYESTTSGDGLFNVKFSVECWPIVRNLEFCIFCRGSSNCFACVGLNKKEYCIFNKQYKKVEYEELVPKIKKHMDQMPYTDKGGRVYKYGEFFPIEFSPFAYNQTLAFDHFMLSKEEVIKAGYAWQDPNPTEYQITIKGEDLPDTIEEVKEDILEAIIGCTKCKKAFRIIKQELEFLRKERIPLPRHCVDCRHFDRVAQRLPSKLFKRQCMCDKTNHGHEGRCKIEFETSFASDRPEIVYCEECYQKEVY